MLDDSQSHTPLVVLREVHDGWQQRLTEQLDSDDLVDGIQTRDDVQSNLTINIRDHHIHKNEDELPLMCRPSAAAKASARYVGPWLRVPATGTGN
jgi:hypothetical protein